MKNLRKKIIMGNWKMNGDFLFIEKFFKEFLTQDVELLSHKSLEWSICSPYVYLDRILKELKNKQIENIKLGAQDVSIYSSGAYTGEISASMLKDIGCVYTLVGHSERRAYHHESNECVAQKAKAAKEAGLTPVICIGETLQQREQGKLEEIIEQQLGVIFNYLPPEVFLGSVIAYEPVWAIGTGLAATSDQVQEVHAFIREYLSRKESLDKGTQILYGGSLKPANAREILSLKDVDGGLIGGASLCPSDFIAIGKAALG